MGGKNKKTEYPRVLLVYNSCIHISDPYGLSLRIWFADWPRDNLAQIYSGADTNEEKFCGRTFKLGDEERRFGKVFYTLKEKFFKKKYSSMSDSSEIKTKKKWAQNTFSKGLSKIVRYLVDLGYYEIIFKCNLSDRLMDWIRDFNPDMIYCQGHNITFCLLPLYIKEKISLPIALQIVDDWPNQIYKNSILSHKLLLKSAQQLINHSDVRLAICDHMAESYKKQFNREFKTIMIPDNLDRFKHAEPKRLACENLISIIYSGSLYLNRWKSILDLSDAAAQLSDENVKIVVFSAVVPHEAVNKLKERENLVIKPPPSHELLPSYLKAADILFLPETFDERIAESIRFSISSKSQLYMMSKSPILVYGSPLTGVVNYAKNEEWAEVVDKEGIEPLKQSLKRLIEDNKLRKTLVDRAYHVALSNHDEKCIKKEFLKYLCTSKGI